MPLPSVFDEIDRLFDELVHRPWGTHRQLAPVEVREVEDGWTVQVPAEGLTAADVQVQVQGNRLTITGHRHHTRERRSGGTWAQTQQEVSIHRTVALPAGADPQNIDAKLEDAILTIHIRRRQP